MNVILKFILIVVVGSFTAKIFGSIFSNGLHSIAVARHPEKYDANGTYIPPVTSPQTKGKLQSYSPSYAQKPPNDGVLPPIPSITTASAPPSHWIVLAQDSEKTTYYPGEANGSGRYPSVIAITTFTVPKRLPDGQSGLSIVGELPMIVQLIFGSSHVCACIPM